MSDKPKNPMAFPVDSGSKQFPYQEGMTLRDYFAAKAMQSILLGGGKMAAVAKDANLEPEKALAMAAYEAADAMLEAREK